MRSRAPVSMQIAIVEITSSNVQRGDVIQVGGREYRVADLVQLRGGAKQLIFETGELLTMHTRTRLVAVRVLRGGDLTRAFPPPRHRR
ncbi:hypothetical protein [Streptomyces sp. NPDC052610]|uniref:hypothetical protein n=1 Tax=Streptomyces sp. NPDC052610 TaxID=3154952 RepID=UPI00341884AD